MNYFLAFFCQLSPLFLQSSQSGNKEKTQLEKSLEAYSKKDYSAALGFIQKQLTENPKDPQGHYLKGLVHNAKGDNEESIKCFELAVKLDPDHAKSWTGLGKALYEIQDYKKSLAALQTAAKKNPKDPENYFLMGKALYDQKAYSVAVRCLDKTIELDPKNKEAKTLRGSCLDKIAFQRLVLVKALALVETTNLFKEKNRALPKNPDPKKNSSDKE